jgi:hypothetical protein
VCFIPGKTPSGNRYESVLSNALLFPTEYCFFEDTHKASLNMSMEHWWNDTDMEKPKHSEKSLSQRHPVHHTYYNR